MRCLEGAAQILAFSANSGQDEDKTTHAILLTYRRAQWPALYFHALQNQHLNFGSICFANEKSLSFLETFETQKEGCIASASG